MLTKCKLIKYFNIEHIHNGNFDLINRYATDREIIINCLLWNNSTDKITQLFTLTEIKSCTNAKECGADTDPVSLAAELGLNDLVKKLIGDGHAPNLYKNFALRVAVDKGNKELVNLLLANPKVGQTDDMYSAFVLAVLEDHTRIIDALLPRTNPADFDNYLVKLVALCGKASIFEKFLKDPRLDLTKSDKEMIIFNTMNSFRQTKGQTMNELLQFRCTAPNEKILRMILADDRFDINICDGYALKRSAESGETKIVQMLLPKINYDTVITQALVLATSHGFLETVTVILADERSDPYVAYKQTHTHIKSDLHYSPRKKILELFVEDSRFDPALDSNFLLVDAAKHGYFDIVQDLIKIPAVRNGPNIDTAITEAKLNNHLNVVWLLKSFLYSNHLS